MASLNQKEKRQFKKKVAREGSIPMNKLVDYLDQHLKAFHPTLYHELREQALKKIGKSVPTDQNKRRLLSSVTQLLSDFLIQQELANNELIGETLLQKQYLRRGLNSLYEASLEHTHHSIIKNPTRDFNHHRMLLQLSHNNYYHATNKYKEKVILTGLKAIHKNLDIGFVMAKLHYACEVKIVKLVREESFPIEFLDEAIAKIKGNEYFDHPVINLYVDILHLIDHPQFDTYQQLKTDWLKHNKLFNKELQHQVFIILLNLSWFSCTENRTDEMYQLYKYGLNSGILIIENKIASSHFNNIIDLGSSLGNFAEVRTFINQFSVYLDVREDKMENIKTLYEAFLLFGEEKHKEALRQSIFLEFKDVSYGLRAYLLTLKCLYECNKSKGYKEIEAKCEAFKQYLQRKSKQGLINRQIKQENINFIKIIRFLPLASASRFANISQQSLLKKLNSMQQIVSKPWLLKKIEGLT